jgi:hypothetical protein
MVYQISPSNCLQKARENTPTNLCLNRIRDKNKLTKKIGHFYKGIMLKSNFIEVEGNESLDVKEMPWSLRHCCEGFVGFP